MSAGEQHLVLVGMMGSGKTTVGRRVAERLGRAFIDSDAQVEAKTGRTVAEIFEAEGEPAFRRLETQALLDALAHPEPAVVAAAGGSVLDAENRRRMREAGTVVWLRVRPDLLVERVRSGDHRPLLAEDPAGVLTRLACERRSLYSSVADAIIDVDEMAVDDAVEAVCAVLP